MEIKFASQLYKYRKDAGYSQDDIAKKMFVSRQAVSKWESGESTPDLSNLVKLAELFEVSLDELILDSKKTNVDLDKNGETGSRPMNGWEFSARYWWLLFALIGLLSWFIPTVIRAFNQ
ncbi:helix-turn-helix transcriptional regulator [Oenococcus alcoholitolerans]